MDNTRKKGDRPGKRESKPGKRENWMAVIHKQTYITRAHNAGGIVRPLRAPEKTIKTIKKGACMPAHRRVRVNVTFAVEWTGPPGG